MATSATRKEEERSTGKYERLLARCKGLSPVPTAVAHPCDESSLGAAVEAAQLGLIAPIPVGPGSKIRSVAERADPGLSACEIVEATHSHEAAVKAVELVRLGRAELLMKGSLHTDEPGRLHGRHRCARAHGGDRGELAGDAETDLRAGRMARGCAGRGSQPGGGPRISVPGSRVSAWVIPTDEERMIAEHTLGVWRRQQGATRPS